MKFKNLRLSILLLSFALTLIGCSPKDNPPMGDPYITVNTRFMLKEKAVVVVHNVNTSISVDFGDGTVLNTTGPIPVEHQYTKAGDYKIVASWGSNMLEQQVRVYSLLALSEAMKQFKDPAYTKVWVMTHRAHTTNKSVPENSCASVRDAISAGADIVELDTHLTKDGEVVVCHNSSINATTNGTGEIKDLTLAQIKSYYLKDRNGNVTSEKMPTLEEYLKEARGKVYVNMDYSPRTASTAQVYNVVNKLNMLEQVFFYCNSEAKAKECFTLNTMCQVYPWYSCYNVLKDYPGVYFVQANVESIGTGAAVAAGAVLSVNMQSVLGNQGANPYVLDTKEVDQIFASQPACRMIQTDTPAELISYLRSKGKR